MYSHVRAQVATLCKCLPACIALVWLLSSVFQLVLDQTGAQGEAVTADVAGERPPLVVNAPVCPQLFQCVESLQADVAGVWVFS